MNRKSGSFFALAALASVLLLGACGGNNGNASPSPTAPAGSPAAGGAGNVQEVTITAVNWKFEPAEIRAKVGDTLKVTLVNEQGAHGVEFADLGVNLKNNESQEIKLDKAGTYEYFCSIQCGQGHDNMTGMLVVE